MGRELRRKQAKKEGKSLQKEVASEKNQIKSLIIITIVLLLFIGIIYLLSALFITKELDWFNNNDTETVETVKNTILAKETFNQTQEEYYVYFYDYTDENEQIKSTVNEKISSKTVYRVDTKSALNANYVSETTNKKVQKLEDLKVKASTVIKIEKGKVTAYYEGNEILEKLK